MKKQFIRGLLTVLSVLFISSVSFCGNEPRSMILSPRVAGMGGAFVAVADDENALFYNPAGLKNIQKSQFTFFNPVVKLGKDYSKLQDFKNDMDAANSIADPDQKSQQRIRSAQKYIPLNVTAGLSFSPLYVSPTFSAALFGTGDIRAEVVDTSEPKLRVQGFTDVTGIVAHPYVLNEKLALGASLRVINRSRYVCKTTACGTVGSSVIELGIKDLESTSGSDIQDKYIDNKKSTGIGIDIGTLYKLNEKVTLGAGIYNLFSTKFDYDTYSNNIPGTVTIGMKYDPSAMLASASFLKDTKVAVDIDRFFNGGSLWKKLHIGVESKLSEMLDLRLGLNAGWPTFGLGLKLGFLNLDYAYFQEERGGYAGQLEDASHIIGLALKF